MADRRVDLVRRARIEQIALEATRSVLPEDAPKEVHWRAMDAAEAAIAPRNGSPDMPAEQMIAAARSIVGDICVGAGLVPREGSAV